MALSLTSAALLVGWGCGDGKPSASSSREEATVKGTVIIFGKPAKKGQVAFDPANYRREDSKASTADIGPDGTYSLKTLVGLNTVRVTGPEAEKAKASYANLECDVKSGENIYDIKLPPE
jgi:hypothetical protein